MTRANDEAIAARARMDAEDARRWAAQMMEAGRIEFGAVLAQFAVRATAAAHRAEDRLEAADAALKPLSPPVPVVPGQLSPEAAATIAGQLDAKYAAGPVSPAAPAGHAEQMEARTEAWMAQRLGPTGNGDRDLDDAARPVDEPAEPHTDVVTTGRCVVQVRHRSGDGSIGTCWGAIYLEKLTGVWRHVNPDFDSQHTPWPSMADPG